MLVGGALGGLLAGSALTSHQVTDRVGTLGNDSYIKKVANEVSVHESNHARTRESRGKEECNKHEQHALTVTSLLAG